MLQNTDKEGKGMKKIAMLLIALMIVSVGFLSGCVDIPDEITDEMIIVSFNVDPSMIDVGDSANLSWVVTGTDTTPTIDNGVGNVGLTGSRIIMPTETTTYTLTATNSTSTKTATTQIIVRDETYYITPTITFQKDDKTTVNTLLVIAADPADLVWSDVELQVNGVASDHGLSGTVYAGTIIDITSIAGTGAYTISIRHIPTNTLIGTYSFTAGTISVPTVTFIKEDKSTINKLTVISADPTDLLWSALEIQVDGTATSHGKTGTVTAGNILDITSIAGTGAYTIAIRHIPTNTLIGTYSFTAGTIPAPTLTFIKEDKATVNTLTVIAADPADLSWGDLELQIDGTATNHGKTGTVTAGTILDITALAGTGAYTISIRHVPSNTLIGTWDFTAAS